MLIIINLPLVGIWVRLLRVPYRLMFPSIVVFCAIGIYSVNNAPVDVVLAGAFGLVGYWLIKHDFEPAPLLLGMVLGPLMEENLRRALLISRGDWSVFLSRPLSAVLLAIAAALLVLAVLPTLRAKRDEVFVESEADHSLSPASARRRRKSNRLAMSSHEMKMPADLAGIFIGQNVPGRN